jgi:hypothetical protein
MPEIKNALASTFVEPRGSARQMIARAAGGEAFGVLGRAAAGLGTEPGKKSPVEAGKIGFLAVFPEEVVLFAGKRGAFKPKPTEDVIASVPRTAIASAELEKKAVKGFLILALRDGEKWEFDMPRAHFKDAKKVVGALN